MDHFFLCITYRLGKDGGGVRVETGLRRKLAQRNLKPGAAFGVLVSLLPGPKYQAVCKLSFIMS